MSKSLRRHWVLGSLIALLFIAGIVALMLTARRGGGPRSHDEDELPAKPEAPSDLAKFRDAYSAGVAAVQRKDGPDAVKHLAAFDFGSRAVEEYRLYYLAGAYEMAQNRAAHRATLAKLWRREPQLVHATSAAFELAAMYESSGNFARSGDVYAGLTRRGPPPDVLARARWGAARSRLRTGDVSAAMFNARSILIEAPVSKEARSARVLLRSLTGLSETAPLPLTPNERLARATALVSGGKPQEALQELTTLEGVAPQLRMSIHLQRGIALHQLRRYEDSNKSLEPLTSGPYKYAIPALRYASRNYAIVASSINPESTKTVKERKRVGTIKQRVGKGKKRRTITKPKYQNVFRQVKLIDLAKKNKKDEYNRLSSERLKDVLLLPADEDVRVEVLNTLITRAAAKNQDAYAQEIIPTLIKLEPGADPALQHFWDKAWAAYTRGDLPGAKKLFRFIADTYTHPNVRRQSEYWFARVVERQGQKEEARAIYQKLASAPYDDLYALHSVARGAKRAGARSGSPLDRKGPDWRELAEKEMPRELRLAYELTALSAMRDAAVEAQRNMRRKNSRFANAILADVHRASGNQLLMYTTLRRAWPQLATVEQDSVPLYFFRMYYPLKFGEEIEEHATDHQVDPNLVRGLILQESYYNPKARSRVGATGLMQLMPPTAKEHAGRMRIPFAVSRLENPDVNIRIGTYHLRMLINMFKGEVPLAVASYNAGQGNVLKWRRGAPRKPMDEFLESIPFPETRNYVKRVTMLRSTYARITGS